MYIFIPHTYIDNNNNVITEIRKAKELSFFKRVIIVIFTIIFAITDNKKWGEKINKVWGIKEYGK